MLRAAILKIYALNYINYLKKKQGLPRENLFMILTSFEIHTARTFHLRQCYFAISNILTFHVYHLTTLANHNFLP